MDKNLIESYKAQMMSMYRAKNGKSVAAQTSESIPKNTTENTEITAPQPLADGEGKLVAIVTTLRSLYPVENARVTVFTGDISNMTPIDNDFTDESGKSKVFTLKTPSGELSLDSENKQIPYALYNMMVEADGYITNIHLNIPVFSSVTSLQRSNMILMETAGEDKGPQIFDEGQKYNL